MKKSIFTIMTLTGSLCLCIFAPQAFADSDFKNKEWDRKLIKFCKKHPSLPKCEAICKTPGRCVSN